MALKTYFPNQLLTLSNDSLHEHHTLDAFAYFIPPYISILSVTGLKWADLR